MAKANYIHAVGRRKQAIARIRLFKKKGDTLVNDMPIDKYFPGDINEKTYFEPFRVCNVLDKYHFTVKIVGSGPSSQLSAVVHGVSRALVKINEEKFKPILKKKGFLTRDPRKKERRKAGTGGKARRKKQSPKR
ncbi:30S ribosomal protein S9 [Patescibacteria group bacterium]